MKYLTAYRIAWIVTGCFFAEAAYVITQIVLTVLFRQAPFNLMEFLKPDNPLYALPAYFHVLGAVFAAGILFGELRRIRTAFYYICCGLAAAITYYILTLPDIIETVHCAFSWFSWHPNCLMLTGDTPAIIAAGLVSAAVSGFVYWFISPRRHAKR
ncbi:MAG: Hypothetical protein BHV28_16390 [Candidatus Tokpelaia hoelldobleri]|uniref:Uncharacterized protein n=1 Tax=Candidatus Tokpelaia hoelldobleri TaxID=1902579 RepID=A0A1U9JWR1_9HYPH|nr:MAG: Hypothetical protein BHV28_16390 [Candidatus Tokpelaia hoelldoblerii]